MTLNKLAFSFLGTLALASTGFAGTAPSAKAPAPVAPAPEQDLGFTLGLGYDSSLIFRGFNLADNWVTGSLDYTHAITNAVRFEAGAIYGSSAGDSFGESLIDDTLGFDVEGLSYERLELNAGFVAELGGGLELGAGYRWYHHMGEADSLLEDGHEVGVSLAAKAGPVNLGVAAYYDFAVEGWYFEAGINSEIKLTDRISLVPGATIGYGLDYTWHLDDAVVGDVNSDGFTAVGLSLALPIKLTKSATLTPYVAANLPVDLLDDVGLDNEVIGGARITVKF
jgi:hypothetical protein